MLELPTHLENQISQLANQAGQPIAQFLDRLIVSYLDEQRETLAADEIFRRIQTGEETTVPFAQLLKDHGLDS